MTHAMNNNNITLSLKFASGVVFTVLNLQYYSWRWLRPLELIEVEFYRGKAVFEVYKWEKEEDKLIAVVVPIKQEVGV
jgi:hypothetical protein